MAKYTPNPVPQNEANLASYIIQEFHRVAAGQDTINDVLGLSKTYVAPNKPYEGQIVYADGTHWNPGDGVGLYQYHAFGWSKLNTNNKNYLLNASFQIAQRGATQTSNGLGSTDRWGHYNNGTSKSVSLSVPSFANTSGINYPYPYKVCDTVVTSVAGASNYCFTQQRIESVRTLAGQKATLSFWAHADATRNMGIGFMQNFGTTGSPSANVVSIGLNVVHLTSGWGYYSYTVDIPSISGKTLGTDNNDYLAVEFWYDSGSTYNTTRAAGIGQQSGTFSIAKVKLEKGGVATPFIEEEYGEQLAKCQRYYQQYSGLILSGYNAAGGTNRHTLLLPVTMRAVPTEAYPATAYTNASALTTSTNGIDVSYIITKLTVTALGVGYCIYDLTLTAEL